MVLKRVTRVVFPMLVLHGYSLGLPAPTASSILIPHIGTHLRALSPCNRIRTSSPYCIALSLTTLQVQDPRLMPPGQGFIGMLYLGARAYHDSTHDHFRPKNLKRCSERTASKATHARTHTCHAEARRIVSIEHMNIRILRTSTVLF